MARRTLLLDHRSHRNDEGLFLAQWVNRTSFDVWLAAGRMNTLLVECGESASAKPSKKAMAVAASSG